MQEFIGGPYPPPPPRYQPLPDAIITVQPAGGGAEITRQVSDSEGRFEIDIPPGMYLLVPRPPASGGYVGIPSQQIVEVFPEKLTLVQVNFVVPLP